MIKTYLVFRELPPAAGRKTLTVEVLSASSGDRLGLIRWWGPWRQYTFDPVPYTTWSDGCLSEIKLKLRELNWNQREAAAATRRRRIAEATPPGRA